MSMWTLVLSIDGKNLYLNCADDKEKEKWLKECEMTKGVKVLKEVECSDDWEGRLNNE